MYEATSTYDHKLPNAYCNSIVFNPVNISDIVVFFSKTIDIVDVVSTNTIETLANILPWCEEYGHPSVG